MYLTIFLLLSVGCEAEAADLQASLTHNSSFQAVAGGWRRTDKGWENAALWVEKSTPPQPEATARDQPSPQAVAYVNFIAQLHPGLIAGVQLLAAVCLLRDRRFLRGPQPEA